MPSPMEAPLKIVLAGEGAIARKHIAGLQRIDGVEVVSVTGGNPTDTAEFAAEFGIPHHTGDLAESLALPGIDAAILTTPTQMHAAQAIQVMEAGKHVLIEIPMADSSRRRRVCRCGAGAHRADRDGLPHPRGSTRAINGSTTGSSRAS